MHAALCLPNGDDDDAANEVQILAKEIDAVSSLNTSRQTADVAMVFDYAGDRAARIQQPDGENYDPLVFTQTVYSCLRQLGISVDIVSSQQDLSAYKLVVISNSTVSDNDLVHRLLACDSHIVLFPRSGSKTTNCGIPDELPIGAFQQLINLRVTRVETLPEFASMTTNAQSVVQDWRERVDAEFSAEEHFDDGWGFHYKQGRCHYINAVPARETLMNLFAKIAIEIELPTIDLGRGLRVSRCGELCMAFNYGPDSQTLTPELLQHFGAKSGGELLLGKMRLNPAEVAAWKWEKA